MLYAVNSKKVWLFVCAQTVTTSQCSYHVQCLRVTNSCRPE